MPLTLSGRYAPVWALLVVASLSIAACGASSPTKNEIAKEHATTTGGITQEEITSVNLLACDTTESSVLEEDAWAWAEGEDIPVDEARRRLRLELCFTDDLADLERGLRNKEADTFAALWIQHRPEYRFVVLFTQDGEQTIRPYLEDEPRLLRRLIEVRSGAEATYAELVAAQREAGRMLDRLKIAHASGDNVKKNRVEIYVKDKARFEAALQEEGARLPEHVVVVESGLCCVRPM